jgi:hypothetical protein
MDFVAVMLLTAVFEAVMISIGLDGSAAKRTL